MIENINFLRIPLYSLHYITDISDLNAVIHKVIKALTTPASYTEKERASIMSSLLWASKHPEYDFRSLDQSVHFSNHEIHAYLTNVYHGLQKAAQ